MVARVKTVAFNGIEVISVDVQIQISSGLPAFYIVGLPDKTVAESRERVRSALYSMGLSLPAKRITVNLAPADIQKEGSHYDLPIVLALLIGMDVIHQSDVDQYVVLGELSLDGTINGVAGVLPSAVHASAMGCGIICPKSCAKEAVWSSPDIKIIAAQHVLQILNHLNGRQVIAEPDVSQFVYDVTYDKCFSEIRGQNLAKRAIEIAAAGGHHLLMIGPPGAGKSMLASRLPTILPPLTPSEALEVSMIYSVANELKGGEIITKRPFRDPHHSSSLASFIGGGIKIKPGEISLAHKGVLFLDELPEFSRQTLEALRQPLETGYIVIARANSHITYPAHPQIIAAMNPCKCGYLGDPERECSRINKCGKEYFNKISGPLLDRIDIHIEVPAVNFSDLSAKNDGETSVKIAKRILNCRELQMSRYSKVPNTMLNSDLSTKLIDEYVKLESAELSFFNNYAEKLKLSARSYHRLLKIIRTIADLDFSETVKLEHIKEGLSYKFVV